MADEPPDKVCKPPAPKSVLIDICNIFAWAGGGGGLVGGGFTLNLMLVTTKKVYILDSNRQEGNVKMCYCTISQWIGPAAMLQACRSFCKPFMAVLSLSPNGL